MVWERTDEGRTLYNFPAPFYFYVPDDDGDYTSMFGDKLSRIDFDTSKEFNGAKAECASNGWEMFESDIPPELKLLSEKYYNVAAPKLHVTFFDIEVDYNPELGFSSIENPYAPINSVAYYHNWSKRMVVYAVPPDNYLGDPDDLIEDSFFDKVSKITDMPEGKVEIYFCKNEKELLQKLLEEIEDSDVLSGWNSDFFDVPYVGKRIKLVLGTRAFNKMSFTGAGNPRWRVVEVMRREMTTLDLSGRASLDYMVLFKKYEMYERPSYKLESIAEEMLPNLPKLEYEGSLAGLYRKDFPYFVRYNLRDTEILLGLEDQLGYVETANQMYHMSTGLSTHVTGTLKLAELATINYCHHDLGGIIVPDNHIPDVDAQIQGALVLLPQVGMHEEISSVDLASLYPGAIRSLNISPETIIGQLTAQSYKKLTANQEKMVIDSGYADIEYATQQRKSLQVYAAELIATNSDIEIDFVMEDGTKLSAPASQFREVFEKKKWACSGYGTIFNQNQDGIIPTILADWYARRKEYKKLMAEAKDAGDDAKAMYYDKLQYVFKIKLNSFYGALTNKYFRFYDLRMGESTTGVGRKVLLHQCAQVCKELNGTYQMPDNETFEYRSVGGIQKLKWHYGYTKDWAVVYGDTDSSYFVTYAKSSDAATEIGDGVANLVNDSFQEFMRREFLCTPGFDSIMQCEREVVSDRGIFVDKKRYILHLVDLDGWKCDKVKVMGLDTKKTTLPAHVSKELNNFVGRLLKKEDWKDISIDIVEYKEALMSHPDLMTIGLPKGVKGVEDYTKQYELLGNDVRLPGHVAASILYNICLKEYKDKESTPIFSGMKIKVFYLKTKIGRFKSIAIPVDIEQVPEWFIRDFTDKIDLDAHLLRLVDKPLGNIIKAIDKEVPSRQQLFIDDVLVF